VHIGFNQGRYTLTKYEVAVLYHPDLEIDLEKASSRVEKIFTDNGSKIISSDNWGKRKLAYPIKNNEHAVYVFYSIEIPAENVSKIESILNITDEVIRFLITKPDVKALAKAEAEKAKMQAKHSEIAEEDNVTSNEAGEE
jgi:small subunit ribosomal protein S6